MSGDARHGRRDNGLVAAAYAAVGDVDPRVGEHLLDVLALEGIAAYLRPSSDVHPVTRSTMLPRRPTDRLYVDREHLRVARDHLARLAREEREAQEREAQQERAASGGQQAGPEGGTQEAGEGVPATADRSGTGPGEGGGEQRRAWAEPTNDEVDRAFAEIVAGLDPRGSLSLGDDDRPEGRRRRRSRAQPRPEPESEPTLLDGLDTFGAHLPDDETERFVPPEPPPVPRPSAPAVLGVAGVVGGLAVFLRPELLSFLDQGVAMFVGFAAVVGGFGTLVWRLRPGSDDDEIDPDDGARV